MTSRWCLVTAFSLSVVLGGVAPVRADSLLFSNLGPGDSFSGGGLAITGPTGPGTEPDRDLAAGFIAASSGRLYAIDLPLSWCGCFVDSFGDNAAEIWFMADSSGRPGEIIESWQVADLPTLLEITQTRELLTVISSQRPKVKKGLQYWVGVQAGGEETLLHWWVNDTGDTGVAGRHGNDPWFFQSGPDAPAFRVRKNPSDVPEPSSVVLFGVIGAAIGARKWLPSRR